MLYNSIYVYFDNVSFKCVSCEIRESELKEDVLDAFRQISISERLGEMSKEVQMLHKHSSMTRSARSFLRQKGHRCIAESSFFLFLSLSCGKHVGISYASLYATRVAHWMSICR